MVLSEIFSTSFLFSMLIVVILVGTLFAYMNYKISEQNHKLNSMVNLVSVLTQEIQTIKGQTFSKFNTNIDGGNNDNRVINNVKNFELIDVSDDEESYEESVEDSDDEDVGTIDNMSDDRTIDTNSDDSINNIDEDNEQTKFIKIDVDVLPDTNNNDSHIEAIDIGSDNDGDNLPIEDEINIEDVTMNNGILTDDIKHIPIDLEEAVNYSDAVFTITEYKRMTVNKLRDIVVAKGFVEDASKMKKNDILKFLIEE